MKNLSKYVFLFASILFIGCDTTNETPLEVPQTIIDKSISLFDGEIIEKNLEIEDGIEAWEVKIQNSDGSVVVFYWKVNQEILLKMKGETGPFAYDINPGNNLINFSTARTVAIGAVKNDTIKNWELQQEEDFIDIWVYSFEFDDNGDTSKVYIDAESGNILQID
jgi:uncharacterized membrane protein YkoI